MNTKGGRKRGRKEGKEEGRDKEWFDKAKEMKVLITKLRKGSMGLSYSLCFCYENFYNKNVK